MCVRGLPPRKPRQQCLNCIETIEANRVWIVPVSKRTTANLLGRLVAGGGDCGHKAGKDVVQERAQLLRLRLAHVAAQQLVACRLVLACIETHSAGLQAEKLLKSTCFITAASVLRLLWAALLWEGGNATACGHGSSCTGMEQDQLFRQLNAPMRTSSGSTPTLSSTPRRKVPAVCQKGTEVMDYVASSAVVTSCTPGRLRRQDVKNVLPHLLP